MSETLSLQEVDSYADGVAEATAIIGMDDDSKARRRELRRVLDQMHGGSGAAHHDDEDFETILEINAAAQKRINDEIADRWDEQLVASSNKPRPSIVPVILPSGMLLYFERDELNKFLRKGLDLTNEDAVVDAWFSLQPEPN